MTSCQLNYELNFFFKFLVLGASDSSNNFEIRFFNSKFEVILSSIKHNYIIVGIEYTNLEIDLIILIRVKQLL